MMIMVTVVKVMVVGEVLVPGQLWAIQWVAPTVLVIEVVGEVVDGVTVVGVPSVVEVGPLAVMVAHVEGSLTIILF